MPAPNARAFQSARRLLDQVSKSMDDFILQTQTPDPLVDVHGRKFTSADPEGAYHHLVGTKHLKLINDFIFECTSLRYRLFTGRVHAELQALADRSFEALGVSPTSITVVDPVTPSGYQPPKRTPPMSGFYDLVREKELVLDRLWSQLFKCIEEAEAISLLESDAKSDIHYACQQIKLHRKFSPRQYVTLTRRGLSVLSLHPTASDALFHRLRNDLDNERGHIEFAQKLLYNREQILGRP